MEKERYMVFDNEKGVLLPLKQEGRSMSLEERNEKAEKIQLLLKSLIKQTVRETVRECNMQLKEEWKEHEKQQEKRWEEMEKDKQHDFKVAFRGGMGYVYSLAFA